MKILGLVVVIVVLFVTFLLVFPILASSRASNHRNAMASLKTVNTAEWDFRMNDRDGNGVNDFWTLDVAGLCLISPPEADGKTRLMTYPSTIRLIEISVAMADADFGGDDIRYPRAHHAPPVATFGPFQPKGGYHFARLLGDATSAYPASDLKRYGFMAFPTGLDLGPMAFITNQDNTVYKVKLPRDYRAEIKPPWAPFQITKSGSESLEKRTFPAYPERAGWTKWE